MRDLEKIFKTLGSRKKHVMNRWKGIVQRAENGDLNQSELCACVDLVQAIDGMILEEARDQANMSITYGRPQKYDFHSLLTADFWDK